MNERGLIRLLSLLVFTSAGVSITGCGGDKPEPPQLPPPRVTVVQPVAGPVRDYWHYNGYLDTTESVEVRSKIRGFLAKVEFKEGSEVEVGDPLYKIERVEFETARNKAKAERDKAEAELDAELQRGVRPRGLFVDEEGQAALVDRRRKCFRPLGLERPVQEPAAERARQTSSGL